MNTIDGCDGPPYEARRNPSLPKNSRIETALFTQMEIIVQTIYIVAEKPKTAQKMMEQVHNKLVQKKNKQTKNGRVHADRDSL